MPKPILICKSVSGRLIKLNGSVRYEKILKDHPEFKEKNEYLEEVKKTIEEPDYVVIGWAGEYLALRYCEIAPAGPEHLELSIKSWMMKAS
ncbi:MAG: hypothetical protein ACUVTD_07710 [Nitrososphaerales archaeon]